MHVLCHGRLHSMHSCTRLVPPFSHLAAMHPSCSVPCRQPCASCPSAHRINSTISRRCPCFRSQESSTVPSPRVNRTLPGRLRSLRGESGRHVFWIWRTRVSVYVSWRVRVRCRLVRCGGNAGWRAHPFEGSMEGRVVLLLQTLLLMVATWSLVCAQDSIVVQPLTCNDDGSRTNRPGGGCRRFRSRMETQTSRKLRASCELMENHCRRKALGGFYRYRTNGCNNSISGCGCCVYAPR